MEFAAVLFSILVAFPSVMSLDGQRSKLDVCIAESGGRSHLERSTPGNVSNMLASDIVFRQSQDMERLMKQPRIQMTIPDLPVIAFRSCCVQKWLQPRRSRQANAKDTCMASRYAFLHQAVNNTRIFHRNMATLDTSFCEDFPTSDTAPSAQPSGQARWRRDDNFGNYTTVNQLDHACTTEEDPEMSHLATPVIFGCLVLLYAGHLAALMMNIVDGGVGDLDKCPACDVTCDDQHADTCSRQDIEESSEDDEADNVADNYNNAPDYFQYGDHTKPDNKNTYIGVINENFFDAIDDDFCSVYWDESASNEVVNAGDEESVDDDRDEDQDTISDGDYESDDGLNDECDDENCDDSSDQDTNSWQ